MPTVSPLHVTYRCPVLRRHHWQTVRDPRRAPRRAAVLMAVAAAAPLLTSCTKAEPVPSVADRLSSELTAYLEDPALDNVRAVIVSAGEETVFEEYVESTADDYNNVFSVTKSVVSTLVGIAVDDGLLDVDGTLAELLPDYADSMSPEVAATTLDQLLTMTGGFPDTWFGAAEDVFTEPDWVAACLGSAGHPPGEDFAYSDPGVHLVGAVLVEATGRPLLEYAREKLFTPLGIDTEPAAEPLANESSIPAYEAADFAWPVDPQGIHLSWGYLKLRPVDMVALGHLVLHEGTWDGDQIVSAAWVRDATTTHVPAQGAAEEYGYLWWVGSADGSPAFFAWGYGGQLIEIVPERDLVVVVSSEVGDPADTVGYSHLTYMVDKIIAPAIDG